MLLGMKSRPGMIRICKSWGHLIVVLGCVPINRTKGTIALKVLIKMWDSPQIHPMIHPIPFRSIFWSTHNLFPWARPKSGWYKGVSRFQMESIQQIAERERECRSERDYEDVVLDLVTALSGVIGIELLCLLLGAVMFKFAAGTSHISMDTTWRSDRTFPEYTSLQSVFKWCFAGDPRKLHLCIFMISEQWQ